MEPPSAQRAGGLEAAVRFLAEAVRALGHPVTVAEASGMPRSEWEDVDLVHFHGLWQPPWPALGRELCARGVPYVVSPHGMLEPWAIRHKWWKKLPYWFAIERRFLLSAASLVATAPQEEARIRTLCKGHPAITLPLGLTGTARPRYREARAELGWAEGEPVLLYLSRLHVKKGLHLLLEALVDLPLPPGTRLAVVGEGEPAYVRRVRAFAKAQAAALPAIAWVGGVWGDARWAYFQGADLFCLPTHSENFGLAVLEALQVGTPVLTTDATPWKTQLAGRGFIAQPTVKSLRKTLREALAKMPLSRENIASWAWSEFDWATLAPRYVRFYRDMLTRPRRDQSSE